MTLILDPTLLALVVPVVLLLALTAPPHVLLCADLATVLLPGRWELAGILFDPSDVSFAGLLLCVATRPALRRHIRRTPIPYRSLWLGLGILASLAYLVAPINQPYLADPVAAAYQLYRYGWKPILYFPLSVWLLGERRTLQAALVATVVAADLASIQAIGEGYAGLRASGPFSSPNLLGGALIVPLIITVAGLLWSAPRQRVFYAASAVILTRTLTFSGSRGAFVATVCGFAVFFGWLLWTGHVRTQLARAAAAGAVLALAVLAAKPTLFESQAIGRLLSARKGTQDSTFTWRMEERWPHFLAIVERHPWFGVGTAVDPSLGGTDGNTPHSGYLAVALVNGVPFLLGFCTLALLGVGNALRLIRRAPHVRQTVLGATLAASLGGILIHNVVEVTFEHDFVAKLLWMLIAIAVVTARRPERVLSTATAAPSAGTTMSCPYNIAPFVGARHRRARRGEWRTAT